MVVRVPVIDVRAHPHTAAAALAHDPLQETQLLYGERVRLLGVEQGWVRVEAIEQPEFTHATRWQGYPGWLPADALMPQEAARVPTVVVTQPWAQTWLDRERTRPSSWRVPMGGMVPADPAGQDGWRVTGPDGSILWMARASARALAEARALAPAERRAQIVRAAASLIGTAYFWGGRSPHDARATTPTGVDCSGLVNLAYRTVGMELPRDAHEQSLRARRPSGLQPADLIFLSERGNPRRIVHVMLYAGDGEIIEAPGTGQDVRRISLVKRLGRPLTQLAPGDVIEGQRVAFGTFFPSS